MISFNKDTIAGSVQDQFKSKQIQENSDVLWLFQQLKTRKFPILHTELEGKHLEPVGVKVGEYIVDLNPLDKFIEPFSSRHLEQYTVKFLAQLRQQQHEIEKRS
ncbi:hypothetical protein A6770_09325 [Nostoc minutum NIES-26]|uniref:Uncharacterized protein n=1 Tax=Nostoc minutum NIES-26 TaxID=1844469 RepID=A0A367RZX2_9NOSO|nr:hypothetical protein A6770_09325 [Nostoc minutum NIES-26]